MSRIDVEVKVGESRFVADIHHPIDLAIRQQFGGPQPTYFGAPAASSTPVTLGSFKGDIAKGGSCNVDSISIIPHCNGTHTEGPGHIRADRQALDLEALPVLAPASLITIIPEPRQVTRETITSFAEPRDLIITERCLQRRLTEIRPDFLDALIIRTLPNSPGKLARDYDAAPAPFFSLDAIHLLNRWSVSHLLIDIPSVDRHNDKKLTCHHVFWETGGRKVGGSSKTITELIYVDSSILDGSYLLNLQSPRFKTDACPSRPVLIPIMRKLNSDDG